MGIDTDQHSVPSVLKKEIALEAFYANLAKQYPNGAALAGSAHMVDLAGIYLNRPPIYGENINKHHDQY